MSGIKIRMVEIDGQMRVPPECMRILLEFADHRDLCDDCLRAFERRAMTYCSTGLALLRELGQQPEVERAS